CARVWRANYYLVSSEGDASAKLIACHAVAGGQFLPLTPGDKRSNWRGTLGKDVGGAGMVLRAVGEASADDAKGVAERDTVTKFIAFTSVACRQFLKQLPLALAVGRKKIGRASSGSTLPIAACANQNDSP